MRRGGIKPTAYEKRYHGLEQVPDALNDLAARKIWGKAMIHITGEAPNPRL